MTLDKYKCVYCRIIEDNVFKCTDNHLVCEKCAVQFKKLCKCKKMLPNNKQINPIDLLIKYETKPCQYSLFGCTWKFTSDELADHATECKYRPYRCIGEILSIWTCDWSGRQLDLPLHVSTVHGESLGASFEFFQKSSVPFNTTETWHSVNIVNAFGRHFVYYMFSDSTKGLIYVIIYLLGRKEEAQNYVINFEIISKMSTFEKIKFTSNCYSDANNIKEMIEAQKCAVLTHDSVAHFVSAGELNFRFIIQRKDDDEFTKKPPTEDKAKPTSPQNKSAPNIIVSKNKGKATVNAVKKSGTIPSIIQPVLKPLTISSESQPESTPAQSTRSSINACPPRNPPSPCYSPSINKDDEAPVRRSDILTRSLSLTPCTTLPPVQPYKNIDDKMYRRRYPENCLTKPAFKR